jgi:DnaA family protein
MRQLALQLAAPPAPTLDNFIPGRNAELRQALGSLADGSAAERFVYLWSGQGGGKTHLLTATFRALIARGRPAVFVEQGARFPDAGAVAGAALVVDDVHLAQHDRQHALFNLYNVLRETQGALVAAGNAPPGALPLRADLLTRLGWGLVYQIHPLSDDEKAAALADHARGRGLRLPAEVIAYVFNRYPRDLRQLMGLLDALDRYSLETKRPITVPLVRELLTEGGG